MQENDNAFFRRYDEVKLILSSFVEALSENGKTSLFEPYFAVLNISPRPVNNHSGETLKSFTMYESHEI